MLVVPVKAIEIRLHEIFGAQITPPCVPEAGSHGIEFLICLPCLFLVLLWSDFFLTFSCSSLLEWECLTMNHYTLKYVTFFLILCSFTAESLCWIWGDTEILSNSWTVKTMGTHAEELNSFSMRDGPEPLGTEIQCYGVDGKCPQSFMCWRLGPQCSSQKRDFC
jgi:hypothetical protein